MRFDRTEEQRALAGIARELLADRSSSARARAAMESERGWDEALWAELSGEQGWCALAVPEQYGGWGFGYVEQAVVLEELGRAMACAPYFSTACLAINALLCAGSEEQKRRLIPPLAEGGRTGALAGEAGGIRARADGAGWVLSGEAAQVIDGATAEQLVVVADGPQGAALFAVSGDAPGLRREALSTLDTSRRRARLRLEGVVVGPEDTLPGGDSALTRALDLARVGLSSEMLGGAEACLDLAVDYAKVRVQFGRPIGSFQAIKHKCADMLLLVESARSAAWAAAWAADHDPEGLAVAASVAKAYASDAFFKCAAESIQIHGGIGFTWEHDAHLYFKRARASAALLGSAGWHRDRIASHLEI
jgi:alkylation response protein AidB-like acyl-CoA dehydrogenase